MSEYLEWVKTRKPARFNLATSGVAPYPLAELGADIDDLEINGPGRYGYQPLQEAIAAHCSVPADCIVAASGTSMANFLAMSALVQPGDEVLIEQPVYEPLLASARYLGADVKRFPRELGIHGFLSSRTKLVVITNLHNPSCARIDEPQLRELAELAKSAGARVLADEVYLECMYEKTYSAFNQGDAFVCTRSLTKAYGLGGLRCGWIIAEPGLARRMWKIKDLIDPSAPHVAEQLSVLAFHNLDRLAKRAKTLIETNRSRLAQFLRTSPNLAVALPDYGTCVFPAITVRDADRFFEVLHDRYDTDVVPGRFFEMPGHFRLGIGGDNTIFAEALERLHAALERNANFHDVE